MATPLTCCSPCLRISVQLWESNEWHSISDLIFSWRVLGVVESESVSLRITAYHCVSTDTETLDLMSWRQSGDDCVPPRLPIRLAAPRAGRRRGSPPGPGLSPPPAGVSHSRNLTDCGPEWRGSLLPETTTNFEEGVLSVAQKRCTTTWSMPTTLKQVFSRSRFKSFFLSFFLNLWSMATPCWAIVEKGPYLQLWYRLDKI